MPADLSGSVPIGRRPLIGASWKMHLTVTQANGYVNALRPLVADLADREVFVLPPFTAIAAVRDGLTGSNVAWGAQDVHPDDWGAHTGDVSAPMLADLECRYVEVGHWERRRDQCETDELIAAKVAAVVRWEMTPIVCVGERQRGDVAATLVAVTASLEGVLAAVPERQSLSLVIAYEPAWAIGKGGVAAAPSEVGEVHRGIHGWWTNNGFADGGVRVIYGGSVDADVAEQLLAEPGVDGLFVGRQGLDPVNFAGIARTRVRAGFG